MTMIRIVKYKTSTGVICGTASLDSSLVNEILASDESYIETQEDIKDKKVVNGALVDQTASEIATKRTEDAWRELKLIRAMELKDSDWRVGEDSPVTNKEEWKTYRQALRDLPANTTDPTNVTWPTKPS